MASAKQAIAPLLTIAVNSLQINDVSNRNLAKQGPDFSFEFNSFLTRFKQGAEENFRGNSMQIQTTLEMIGTIGQNFKEMINEVFGNFEKMNLGNKGRRAGGVIVQELKIFFAAGDRLIKSSTAREKEITNMDDNQVAELARIFQKILMEVESRARNNMIECLGRFSARFDQEFNRLENHSQVMLEKLNSQEEMIGSLLTNSGEEVKDKVYSQKIERLWVKMGE
jgi:hypothetical protein